MTQSSMIVAINRPIAQVFAFVANAETAPAWQAEMVDVQCASPGPIGIGTTYRALRTHLRERVELIIEITEYEPQRKVTFEGVWDSIRFRDCYDFRSVGDSTRITYGFEPATRVRGTRHVCSREAADLSTLKAVLEGQGRVTGPDHEAARIWAPHGRGPVKADKLAIRLP